MKIIGPSLLDQLTAAARSHPRLRQNHNLHAGYDEPCQRLLNAVEPGSYIRPHRHLDPPRPETFVIMRGRLGVFVFREDGHIEHTLILARDGAAHGVDLPAGAWHTVLALETGTVFFETKPGPYLPLDDKDWAPWAPAEGSVESAGYLERLMVALEGINATSCGELARAKD
ncbi:WbuC family cupin fold metalloprotein [Geoalkalibacter sp.]|uniref:WbuC family cupin fold metalloprotein n=1 Tax=Geoalkalibacter sp. TaxID=3041440 RepID=UPI00272DEB42|nr:WbuC family cupin fold metalloprotein [Geoalkalibacter sp.]